MILIYNITLKAQTEWHANAPGNNLTNTVPNNPHRPLEWLGSNNYASTILKVYHSQIIQLSLQKTWPVPYTIFSQHDTERCVGIGLYRPVPNSTVYTNTVDFTPRRNLDIYGTMAQLRLTSRYNPWSPGLPGWNFTDFYATNKGDLIIKPWNSPSQTNVSTGRMRYVGIQTFNNNPSEMLDVWENARFRLIPPYSFAGGKTYDILLACSTGNQSSLNDYGVLYRSVPFTGPFIVQGAENGVTIDPANSFVNLGDPNKSIYHAKLLWDTYVPLNDFNIWWFDHTPTLGKNRFTIGNKHYVVNPGNGTFSYSKFNVSNVNEYNTASILSSSPASSTVLWVDHSNWTWAPGTSLNTTTSGILTGIMSRISKGSPGDNIAIHGYIDSSLALGNIAVIGNVIRSGSLNLPLGYEQNVSNIGGQFGVSADYRNKQNHGLIVSVGSNRGNNYLGIPFVNRGMSLYSEAADTVHGIYCKAYDANLVNMGLIVESTVDANYSQYRAPDVWGGRFLAKHGWSNNTGVYAAAGSLNNSTNIAFYGEVGTNPNCFKNIGVFSNASNNSNVAMNKGFWTVVSNNTYSTTATNNRGLVADLNFNYFSSTNIGVIGNVSDNSNNSNQGTSQCNTGVQGFANNNAYANQNTGIQGFANGNAYANQNIGVRGEAINDTNATFNIGVAGYAYGSANLCNGANGTMPTQGNIGIYGYGGVPQTGANQYRNLAGFFNGHVVATNLIWSMSDEKLKEKINNMDSALNKISLLNPKTYYFKSNDFPGMALPNDLQYGLLAQDVIKIFPTLVGDFVNPAMLDTSGKEIYPAVPFKAVSYQSFIPILIQSIKELKGNNDTLKVQNESLKKDFEKSNNSLKLQNDSLKSVLTKMQEQINNINLVLSECCKSNNRTTGMNDENKTDINSTIKIVPDNSVNGNKTELYQNKPNPFKTITTFTYLLGTAGFVELEITDQYGQLIEKLVSTNQETGNYSIDWDSVKVAPGVYFYSLKVNSLLLVKKAIKVN